MLLDVTDENDYAEYYRRLGETFLDGAAEGLRTLPIPELGDAINALRLARRDGNRVYALGNGGSASTASHLVCDLVKTATRQGEQPLRAFALNDNTAVLTAYANDVHYDETFSMQLAANAEPGDIVIVISASGSSPNVLTTLHTGRRLGLTTMGMLGCNGGSALDLVDIPIVVDSSDFGIIETAHIAIVHAFAAALMAPDPQHAVALTAVRQPAVLG